MLTVEAADPPVTDRYMSMSLPNDGNSEFNYIVALQPRLTRQVCSTRVGLSDHSVS